MKRKDGMEGSPFPSVHLFANFQIHIGDALNCAETVEINRDAAVAGSPVSYFAELMKVYMAARR
jgi:hypothetical protein